MSHSNHAWHLKINFGVNKQKLNFFTAKWKNIGLLHDNAKAHTARITQEKSLNLVFTLPTILT